MSAFPVTVAVQLTASVRNDEPVIECTITAIDICEQVRDPARNGGRKVEDLIDHIGKDTLVGWAWKPGFGRSPAPARRSRPARWWRLG